MGSRSMGPSTPWRAVPMLLPRLRPPTRALVDRPFSGVFFSVYLEKLAIPRATLMHGCVFRNRAGVTKFQLFDRPGEGPAYEHRWDPSRLQFTSWTPERVHDSTVDAGNLTDCWLPQSGSGPQVEFFERSGERRLMLGLECAQVRFTELDRSLQPVIDETWIADELETVVSDVFDTSDVLSRWELVHLELREPPPEALEITALADSR